MLDRAKFLVVSEISEVVGETAEATDVKVDKALGRCFVNRERAIARGETETGEGQNHRQGILSLTRAPQRRRITDIASPIR